MKSAFCRGFTFLYMGIPVKGKSVRANEEQVSLPQVSHSVMKATTKRHNDVTLVSLATLARSKKSMPKRKMQRRGSLNNKNLLSISFESG